MTYDSGTRSRAFTSLASSEAALTGRRSRTAGERRKRMQRDHEEFVEPEIVKHAEKLADVTATVGYLIDDTVADGAPT
jgi:hypothetical protein